MACQLYNRLAFGVPEIAQPGFSEGACAFIELGRSETLEQLRPLLVDALKQLKATGFEASASAAELATVLRQHAEQQRILLMVDNVWTAEQVELLLPRGLHADSRVIITSRADSMPQSEAWRVRGRVAVGHRHVAGRASLAMPCGLVPPCVPVLLQFPCGGLHRWEACQACMHQHKVCHGVAHHQHMLLPRTHTASCAMQELKRQGLLINAHVAELDPASAQQLFSSCAGSEALPPELHELQAPVIAACSGLPLALRVAGGLLYDKTSKEVWQVCQV
jgi:hypothetical protein